MTPSDYATQRALRGSRASVAGLLGVSRTTLFRRETGLIAITREAWIALNALPKRAPTRSRV
jgi:hypothetical protein